MSNERGIITEVGWTIGRGHAVRIQERTYDDRIVCSCGMSVITQSGRGAAYDVALAHEDSVLSPAVSTR